MAKLPEKARTLLQGALNNFKKAPEINSSAHLSTSGVNLAKHLTQLEKYGQAGFKELEGGRFRYYGNLTPAKTPGEMIGRRVVREGIQLQVKLELGWRRLTLEELYE